MKHKHPPKLKKGDRVRIIDPEDIDYHLIVVVQGLSPSTQKKRSRGQWRYELSNGAFISENLLEVRNE